MDAKKIAAFMKQLRSEKGYTQEQLGEALGVSGRSVSRWETGVNLPELSILMQMADFYNVEIKELLTGEREADRMNDEMKETLKMASDYNELLKKKAMRDSNIAFIVSFHTCTLAIIIQMLLFESQRMIIGETAVLLAGGLTYIVLLLKDGAWDVASKVQNTRRNHLRVSTGTSLVMSVLFYFKLSRMETAGNLIIQAILFFVVMSVVSYFILRLILKISESKKTEYAPLRIEQLFWKYSEQLLLKRLLFLLSFLVILTFLTTGSSALAAGENNVEVYDFSDFDGKNIGVLTGSVQEKLVSKQIPGAVIQYFDGPTDMILALRMNKIDAVALPYLLVQSLVNKNDDLVCDSRILGVDDVCFAFSKSENGKKYQDEFNEFLNQYKETNDLAKLADIYLNGEEEQFSYFDLSKLTGENGTISYGTSTQVQPFSFMTGNGLTGVDMEIVYRFCEKYQYQIEVEDVAMASELAGLTTGVYDMGGGGIAYTSERAENVYFSEPYFKSKQVLVEVKGSESAETSGTGLINRIKRGFEKTFLIEDRWKLLVRGLKNTLTVTFAAVLLASAIGVGFAWLMCSGNAVFHAIAKGYHYIMQGLPIVVVLMLLYYVLFSSVRIDPRIVAVVGFGVSFGPGMGEGLYGAIQSVIKGEKEASMALGFTSSQTFLYITLPQALKKFLPGYRSQIVGMLKGTSVVGYIAIQDVTKMADIIRSRSFEAFFPICTTAVIYFLLVFIIQFLFERILKKMDHTGKRKAVKGVER